MSIVLTVNGTSYEFPENNEDPNWAQDVTQWAEAMSLAVTDLQAASDLIVGSEVIGNNVTSSTPIPDLVFSPQTIRAVHIAYVVHRKSTANPSGNYETGTIYVVYDEDAASGSIWNIGLNRIGTAGVSFTMTDFGQLEYTSTDINSTGYVGSMTYSVKVFLQ